MNDKRVEKELPLGLGMALVQNASALKAFGALSVTEQQNFIENAHDIDSSDEMRRYVDTLVCRGGTL